MSPWVPRLRFNFIYSVLEVLLMWNLLRPVSSACMGSVHSCSILDAALIHHLAEYLGFDAPSESRNSSDDGNFDTCGHYSGIRRRGPTTLSLPPSTKSSLTPAEVAFVALRLGLAALFGCLRGLVLKSGGPVHTRQRQASLLLSSSSPSYDSQVTTLKKHSAQRTTKQTSRIGETDDKL